MWEHLNVYSVGEWSWRYLYIKWGRCIFSSSINIWEGDDFGTLPKHKCNMVGDEKCSTREKHFCQWLFPTATTKVNCNMFLLIYFWLPFNQSPKLEMTQSDYWSNSWKSGAWVLFVSHRKRVPLSVTTNNRTHTVGLTSEALDYCPLLSLISQQLPLREQRKRPQTKKQQN